MTAPRTGCARLAGALIAGALIAGAPATARAERRAIHGSAGAGGALLVTGGRGDRARLDLAIDVKPRGRLGGLLAWRALDDRHRGIATAGIVFEAAAARPRVVVDLHAAAGIDLDARAPAGAAGVRTTLAIIGRLAVVLDSGGVLVADGFAETRLQLYSSALVAVRW